MAGRRLDPVDRRILALALPALGALAVEPLYILVDTAIVGRIGTDELAGLAIAAALLSFVFAGMNFLTYGTTERVARRTGAGDPTAAADVGVQALWLAALTSVVLAPLLWLGARPMASVLGGSGRILEVAVEYLRISAVGIPFVLVTLAVQGVMRGVSDYRTPLVVLLVSNVANVVIEVWFVFGLDLEIAGSAWSTVIAQGGAAVAFAVLVVPRLRAASVRRPDRAGLAPLMAAGRHLLLRVGSMLVVFAGATAVAARVDDPTLAAHQVAMSMFAFLALTLDALAVPAQTLVAEEQGRRGDEAAWRIAGRSVRMSVLVGLGLGIGLAVSSPWLPSVFSNDEAVTDRATAALLFLALALVPAAVAFAHDGILIGAGDYRFLGLAALAYLVAVAPFAALTLWFDLGLAMIWIGLTVWMVLRAAVNHRRTASLLGVVPPG